MKEKTQPIELLAILGRGLKEQDGKWFLTRDLEMGNEQGMYTEGRGESDDSHPQCLIGGGELNCLAGAVLCSEHLATLKYMVCAYGARAPYLVALDGPSESEVMTEYLKGISALVHQVPCVEVWPRTRSAKRSNTDEELLNIFHLAAELGYKSVGIVTIAGHYARALLMAQRHLVNPKFAHLTLQFFVSEDILLRADPDKWGKRIREMHGSQAFMRMLFMEQRGVNALLAGTYGK